MLLNDPQPPLFMGIEEPENHLHPRLLIELAEECRQASVRSQMFVTTHSPFFVNGLHPKETWVLYRDQNGFTQAVNTAELTAIPYLMKEGAQLGYLWMEGHFGVGDPLTNHGSRSQPIS